MAGPISREGAVVRQKLAGYTILGLNMDGEDWLGLSTQSLDVASDGQGNRHAIYKDITGQSVLGVAALGNLTT